MVDNQHEVYREQSLAIKALGVRPVISPGEEFTARSDFLSTLLIQTKKKCFVLGISGGVDSLTAGLIAQQAVVKARLSGHVSKFVAMRLPYGEQHDEADAQLSLELIRPDQVLTLNIKEPSDGMLLSAKRSGVIFDDVLQEDFILGNIKARQRMIAQYAIAGREDGLVIGTDHAAEALMGFFTKHGDGACDVAPLSGLNKRQVRSLAHYGGAGEQLFNKTPTADLETLAPLKPDELSFGVTYDEIDDFLEGKPVSEKAYEIILKQYKATEHKRRLPVSPSFT